MRVNLVALLFVVIGLSACLEAPSDKAKDKADAQRADEKKIAEDVITIKASDKGLFMKDRPWEIVLYPDGRAELTVWGSKKQESTFKFEKSKFEELVKWVRAPEFAALPESIGGHVPDGGELTIEVIMGNKDRKTVKILFVSPKASDKEKKDAQIAINVWKRIRELVGDRAKRGPFGP